MHLIGEYIKYKLNSKGKHDIHSPFVFDFVTKCLTSKLPEIEKNAISKLKKSLSKDQRVIEITDFGAGSKKLNSKRTVEQIYRNASSKGVYADLLFQLMSHYKLKSALEFGTSLGLGSIHLALGNSDAQVVSLDACLETQKIAQNNIEGLNIKNIVLINSTFETYIEKLNETKFDLIFIDGHHDGKALKNYLFLLENYSHDETIFVLDDIRWSEGMFKAWNEICASENFHLSLDLFRMGIVVRRTHQAKEHFVIKLKGVLKGMM